MAQDPPQPADKPAASAPAAQETTPAAAPAKESAAPAQEAAPAKEAAPAAPISDRVITGSVDLGYRFVSSGGNPEVYRTVVNLGEGPKVLNFDLSIVNPTGKYYDKITLFGTGWGGDPNESARLDATKQRLYDLHIDYRNIAYYNFLPSFADPLASQNAYQTYQGFDIRRRNLDAELRFRPGTRIIPFLAFSRNWGTGRGVSTFALDATNQYPIFNALNDQTNQYRAGVNVELKTFHATFEQGGTTFKDDQDLSTNNQNPGANLVPFFGQTLDLTNLNQAYRIRGDSIFERVLATFTPSAWVDVSGSILYSRPRTDVRYNQSNTGSFVDLAALEFYSSQTTMATASSSEPHTSGNINVEVRPLRRIRILETWMTDRYHTTSAIDISNLTNIAPAALTTLGSDYLGVTYNRQQIQANVDLTPWLTVHIGHRYVWGDTDVRAPLQNSPAQFEFGELRQQVALFGLQARAGQKLWINGDAEIASTSQVYFRTSLADYRKGTLRARYQLLNNFSLTGNLSALTNSNPDPAIRFDLTNYAESLGFLWNPQSGKRISVLGDYTRSSLSTDLNYYMPQDLTLAASQYRENSHNGTLVLDVASPISGKYAPKLSVGGSFFKSAGTRPTEFYSPVLKLNVPVYERVQFFTEWRYYGLSETFYSYEGFRSNLFVTGLRLVR
jgi:hypothetical protein